MAICPSNFCDKIFTEMLKMSMVPLPCQECQMSARGCVRSENIEWLLELKGQLPIWSRLNEINTAGYKRNLPMSKTKCYDVEIPGRLWSLWGTIKSIKLKACDYNSTHKPYLAATVMALCAARVFRLNIWSKELMDWIAVSGECYLKDSLNNFTCKSRGFQLEDLLCECSLEGIHFKVCIRTKQEGCLYSVPFRGRSNLAFALINFLARHKFGIVECFNRFLGFGFIPGSEGGYFMFDGQSMNYPLFRNNHAAPYMLRTNHLQILLYCLIVALNVPHMKANFCIHNLEIEVLNSSIVPQVVGKFCKLRFKAKPEKSKKLRPTADFHPSPCTPKNTKDLDELDKSKEKFTDRYQRAVRSSPNLEVEDFLIKPLADIKQDLKEDQEFVKMICSDTIIALTEEEKMARLENSFVKYLPDGFIWN